MFVCLCNKVTDSDIANAVAAGAQDFDDIKAMTGAATCCGQCDTFAKDLTADIIQNGLFHSAA